MEKAGLTTSLSSLVPRWKFSFEGISRDQAALRTGVSLSDIILTIREHPKEELSKSLKALHSGLRVMGSGSGLLETVEELGCKVDNDSITHQDLMDQLEAIVSMSIPEHGFGKDDHTGPLLQAGAWTTRVNLIGKAMLEEDKTDKAGDLLHLQGVADYFLKYVDAEGKDKAPEAVLLSLKKTLLQLKALVDKEKLDKGNVVKVVQLTDQLL